MIAYVVTPAGKVTASGCVAAKLVEFEPASGPIVEPFTRTNRPAVVAQISPLVGVAGATPGGTLKPERTELDGDVVSGPVSTPPEIGSGTNPSVSCLLMNS